MSTNILSHVCWCVSWLQIRMQAQGSLLQGSMMSNFMNIYQTEGTRGLWRVSAGCSSPIKGFSLGSLTEIFSRLQCILGVEGFLCTDLNKHIRLSADV